MTDALALESAGARARRFAFPIPDALLALVYALAAVVEVLPPSVLAYVPAAFHAVRDGLLFALFVEGGFLMMQATLVDIATRLKKRPPLWTIPLILGGVLLFDGGGSRAVLAMGWQRGTLVFVPLLLSLLERGYLLWQMPVRTPIQKIAARALISNRIATGVGLCAVLLAAVAVTVVRGGDFHFLVSWPVLAAGAIYFAVAAYDDLRVRGRRFAEAPRVLFRWEVVSLEHLGPL